MCDVFFDESKTAEMSLGTRINYQNSITIRHYHSCKRKWSLLDFSVTTVSGSAVVVQLAKERSELIETLSISLWILRFVSLIATATIPMMPAMDSRVIIAIGKLLSCWRLAGSSKLSSWTETKLWFYKYNQI